MKDSAIGCLIIAGAIVLVIVLSLVGLIWGGVLKVGNTIIERQVVVHSQQYITSHNEHILSLIRDFESLNNSSPNSSGRRTSIVNQICSEASEITHDEQSNPVQSFVAVHC